MPKPTFAPLKTAALAGLLAASACAADPMYGTDDPLMPVDPGPPTWPRGLHVVGTEIQDGANQTIRLYGVNRSGTEYQCVHSSGFFDGPSNEASVAAILNWPKVNAVRVPLNESCWLGINGAPGAYAGDQYKMAIQNYVNQLHKQHLIPILELHWVGPGTSLATRQQPMPDADHAPAFWADVAATFAADDGVVLEPYNEPFPDGNKDSDAGWQCWRDGCSANQYGTSSSGPPTVLGTYQAAGMQSIVDAIRGAGAKQIVLLGGLQYSNALTQWLTAGTWGPRPSRPPSPSWRRRSARATAWGASSRRSCSGSTSTATATSPGHGTRSAPARPLRGAPTASPGRSSSTTRAARPTAATRWRSATTSRGCSARRRR